MRPLLTNKTYARAHGGVMPKVVVTSGHAVTDRSERRDLSTDGLGDFEKLKRPEPAQGSLPGTADPASRIRRDPQGRGSSHRTGSRRR